MAATITLNDIQEVAQITLNVESRLISFQINAVRSLDLDPTIGTALMAAIDTAFSDSETYPETYAFFIDFVKPYWSLSAYVRFMAAHGVNVTQFGVTTSSDPRGTFSQASDQQRANILRQADSDKKVYKTKLVEEIKDRKFTFDGVTYAKKDELRRSNKLINPIKRRNQRVFDNRRVSRASELYGDNISSGIISDVPAEDFEITSSNIVNGNSGEEVNYTATADSDSVMWSIKDLDFAGYDIDIFTGRMDGVNPAPGVYRVTLRGFNYGTKVKKEIEVTFNID